MDIAQAFGYISEDEKWTKKVLIGAIVGAIPLVNFAIFGYQVQIARNVAAGMARPLPDWDDFGRFFVDGLRVIAGLFVYLLPPILLFSCLTVAMVAIMQPAANQSYDSSAPPPEVIALIFLMFFCFMPYSLFTYVIMPLFGIQVARVGSLGACFNFSEMWRLVRAQPVNYLLIVLLFFGLYMAGSLVLLPAYILILIPCLGYLLLLGLSGAVVTLVLMVTGHLQGQFIRADDQMQAGAVVGENEEMGR